MLACEHIDRSYPSGDVLIDCSLSVPAGTCMLISGPSGGGKSTLLRILALQERPDSGAVLHGAMNYRFPDGRSGGDRIGSPFPFLTMVFQQVFLWPHLTIAQNLTIVLHGALRHSLTNQTLEVLERFGVDHLLDHLPYQCSLGQRQRIAIARALLTPAQFLILDEPSSALDRANRTVLVNELADAKVQGRGLLVVSHGHADFKRIADQHVDLEEGRLIPRPSTRSD